MLKIKCHNCGVDLKAGEVIIEPFYNYINDVKYKDFNTTCSKCGGEIFWERFINKAEENKKKALEKMVCKTGKSIDEIISQNPYDVIMTKVKKRAKELTKARGIEQIGLDEIDDAINELPSKEKNIVLAYEDAQNMAILNAKYYKPIEQVSMNAVLLANQAIIISALEDKDKDFFKGKYGGSIVDAYNSALTLHKNHDFNITAKLLLEKIESGQVDAMVQMLQHIQL